MSTGFEWHYTWGYKHVKGDTESNIPLTSDNLSGISISRSYDASPRSCSNLFYIVSYDFDRPEDMEEFLVQVHQQLRPNTCSFFLSFFFFSFILGWTLALTLQSFQLVVYSRLGP